MKGTFWQPGANIDYVNSGETEIPANTVVALGTRIGVAGTDIPAGATGSVITTGVFIFTKTSSSESISLGDTVYFDGTGITKTANASTTYHPIAGWAVKASANGTSEVYVKIDSAAPAATLENVYTKTEVDALIPSGTG